MSTIQMALSAAIGLGIAACAGAPPLATDGAPNFAAFAPPAPFTCRIEATAQGGRTDVRASLSAHAPLSGLYWLDLGLAGPGGSATVSQSGPFSVAAGETLTLGTARFGAAPAALRGRLTLTWAGGEVRCPVTAPMVPL